METSSDRDLLWDQQQQRQLAYKAQEHRDWLKNFALIAALIVLALFVARLLPDVTIRGFSVL